MRLLRNKFFLIGNLVFLILAIPVVLYLIKNQTTTRSGAVASTTLTFTPTSISTTACSSAQTARLFVNPGGQNAVNSIDLSLNWDKTKYTLVFTPNSTAFPQILSGPTQTPQGMQISLNINNVTNAITTSTEVGVISLTPSAAGTANLTINATETAIYSLAPSDGTTENVYNAAGSSPLTVNITACGNTPTPTHTPVPTGGVAPTATNTPVPTATPTRTPTPSPTTGSVVPTSTNTPTPTRTPTPTSSATSSTTNSSSSTATATPTRTPTPTKTLLAQANTSVSPTIAEPGGVSTTFVIIGVILLILIAGVFLLAL